VRILNRSRVDMLLSSFTWLSIIYTTTIKKGVSALIVINYWYQTAGYL